eukprot:gene4691-9299_t
MKTVSSLWFLMCINVFQESCSSRLALLKRISSSFTPTYFNIGNWLIKNPHYQTIIGSEAIRLKLTGHYPRTFESRVERWNTDDGDFVDLEFTMGAELSDKIVIILHGLESNPKSPLVTRMTQAFLNKGFACCLVSFRSCSQDDNLTVGAYHLGFTDDINMITKKLAKLYPDKSLYLSGFSLGGNVILKFLGELGEEAWNRNIKGAAVTCVPFDPVACQSKIDVGFNRAVYSENFLQSLKRKAERKHLKFPGVFDIEAVRKCRTIGEFDDIFIAKIYGFKNNIDYYRKSGSKWWLPKIRIPVIAINAIDDPFIDENSLPTIEDIGNIAPVQIIYHENGGHCGFIGHDITNENFEIDNENELILRKQSINQNGWLPEELARALEHIHFSSSILDKNVISFNEIDTKVIERLIF